MDEFRAEPGRHNHGAGVTETRFIAHPPVKDEVVSVLIQGKCNLLAGRRVARRGAAPRVSPTTP
jgi:hypothetical protein